MKTCPSADYRKTPVRRKRAPSLEQRGLPRTRGLLLCPRVLTNRSELAHEPLELAMMLINLQQLQATRAASDDPAFPFAARVIPLVPRAASFPAQCSQPEHDLLLIVSNRRAP